MSVSPSSRFRAGASRRSLGRPLPTSPFLAISSYFMPVSPGDLLGWLSSPSLSHTSLRLLATSASGTPLPPILCYCCVDLVYAPLPIPFLSRCLVPCDMD
ncbi:hypothetical protein BDZ89DRAFT_614154 [Hymenopellis radicata]|nr:hypothetical protein BDZ89DRAFT_614154 [Hymenopellis radicata]